MDQEQKERLFSVLKVMGAIIGIAGVWTAFGFLWGAVIPKNPGYFGRILVLSVIISPLCLALLTSIIIAMCKLYFWIVCGHTEYYEYEYYIMENKQEKLPKKKYDS